MLWAADKLARPEGIGADNYRMFIVLDSMSYLGIVAHGLFIPLFFWLGVTPLAVFNVVSVIVWCAAWWLNRRGRHYSAIVALSFEVVMHASLAVYFLGWNSGFHYYLVPMITFLFFNHKQRARLIMLEAIGLFALYVGLYSLAGNRDYSAINPDLLTALNYINIAVNFIALGILGYYFREASITAEAKMEQLASTDTLTNLYNRRKMREFIEIERVRQRRSGEPFLLVLADIDHFKQFNDTYGHDCGDYVLQEVARLMQDSLRDQDLVSRWGGEEFLIMLPQTRLDGGARAIEKLRRQIQDSQLEFTGHAFGVTLTFGVAEYDGDRSLDACLKAADDALYQGKHSGRNRVVTAA